MNPLKNNRGVTLVFIALFLFLLLMFLGLAVDVGWTTYVRNQGQARVDAAALAAASALISQVAATRQSNAQTQAATFASSSNNIVVDASTSTSVTNVLTPMKYNYSTKTLSAAAGWDPTVGGALNCNAVKVTNAVPTPLFFSGIRNVFGGTETGSTTINVEATGYLGCPGTAVPPLPLAFCSSAINYPTNCNVANGLQAPNTTNNSGFFDPASMGSMSDSLCKGLVNGSPAMPAIGGETTINLNNGQLTSCLQDIKTQYNAKKDVSGKWCVPVPVVDACDFNQSQPVAGFAMFCITEVIATGNPKYANGFLQCPSIFRGGSGGKCFGTVATNPILVQ